MTHGKRDRQQSVRQWGPQKVYRKVHPLTDLKSGYYYIWCSSYNERTQVTIFGINIIWINVKIVQH